MAGGEPTSAVDSVKQPAADFQFSGWLPAGLWFIEAKYHHNNASNFEFDFDFDFDCFPILLYIK